MCLFISVLLSYAYVCEKCANIISWNLSKLGTQKMSILALFMCASAQENGMMQKKIIA